MARQKSSGSAIAGAISILGLGLVWVAIVANFPSHDELSSAAQPADSHRIVPSSSSQPAPLALDLTIPISPPLPSETAKSMPGDELTRSSTTEASVPTQLDLHEQQATRLQCEADIEQLCPDSPDGSARTRCLQRRAKELPPPCQSQLHERFVKWKEDRIRFIAACHDDVRQFCSAVKRGGGQILQCLQSHSQEVSDRCYQTLPKGTLFFK